MEWDDVCKTRNEGGLGLRRSDDVAKVIAIKLVWKSLQGDSLWARWLKNKYCKNRNFWTIQLDNNISNTCKSLLKARTWCKGIIGREISNSEDTHLWFGHWLNSEDTHLWFDHWLKGSSIIDKVGRNYSTMMGGPNNKVFSS